MLGIEAGCSGTDRMSVRVSEVRGTLVCDLPGECSRPETNSGLVGQRGGLYIPTRTRREVSTRSSGGSTVRIERRRSRQR